MGYYAIHTLIVKTGKHTISEVAEAVDKLKVFTGFCERSTVSKRLLNTHSSGDFYIDPYDFMRWSTEEEDMKQLSLEFPDALFIVCGEGECQGDVWENQYRNGKKRERLQISKMSAWEGDTFEDVPEEADDCIAFQHGDKTFQMTKDEIYAAYRYQQRLFVKEDIEYAFRSCYIDAFDSREEAERDFAENYGLSLSEAEQFMDQYVDCFFEDHDSRDTDNDRYQRAIEKVIDWHRVNPD